MVHTLKKWHIKGGLVIICDSACKNCVFHNLKMEYGCEMAVDLPVICSVKMKKMKEFKKQKLEGTYNEDKEKLNS